MEDIGRNMDENLTAWAENLFSLLGWAKSCRYDTKSMIYKRKKIINWTSSKKRIAALQKTLLRE